MKILCIALLVLFSVPVLAQVDDPFDESATGMETEGVNAKPLEEVFKQYWDRWGKGNTRISTEDLLALLGDPSYKSEASAAMVALVKAMKADNLDDIGLDEAISRSKGKMTSAYLKNVKKINGIQRVLYANGTPTFELMQQGPAGDCYFFSGTGWMAVYRNAEIVRCIRQLENGKYKVKFPNSAEAVVSEPTDAEIAYNDSPLTVTDGIWMPVLEKALGVIEGKINAKRDAIPDPTARIDLGGSSNGDVKFWTGHNVIVLHFRENCTRHAVKEGLIRMKENKLMAQASVPKKPNGKLPGNHVYAIMDFDPHTEMLTVWNPWGTDYKPKGPDSPENGYARKHGIFHISLDDFMQIFYYMAIEIHE